MKNYLILLLPLTIFANSYLFSQCDSTIISGDYVISSNTVLAGSYYVTGNFKIENNVVVDVMPYSANSCGELRIYAQKITINGSINADGCGYVGGSGGSSGSSIISSTGDASGLVGCSNSSSTGQIELEGGLLGSQGFGIGAGGEGQEGRVGSGPKQVCGSSEDYAGMLGGSSGASSGGGASYGGIGEEGGFGGDGDNSFVSSNLTISNAYAVNAGYGKSGGIYGIVYGTISQYDISIGSGGGGAGGGGRSYDLGGSGNDGGSGGGLVLLNAYTDSLIITGEISANGIFGGFGGFGGSGGIGQSGSTGCCSDPCNDCGEKTFSCGSGGGGGAGGGSGGGILLIGNGINYITGNLNAKGGDGGSGGSGGFGAGCSYNAPFGCGGNQSVNTNNGNVGDSGGAGGGGRIKVFASDCFGNIILPNTDVFGGNGVLFADEGSIHFDSDLPCLGVEPPPVGIDNVIASKLYFNLFPNPSSGLVKIKFSNSFVNLKGANLSVYDVFGKLVFASDLSSTSWSFLAVDLNSLSDGVYLVKVGADKFYGEQKLIISK